jgi:hypothetical protein
VICYRFEFVGDRPLPRPDHVYRDTPVVAGTVKLYGAERFLVVEGLGTQCHRCASASRAFGRLEHEDARAGDTAHYWLREGRSRKWSNNVAESRSVGRFRERRECA